MTANTTNEPVKTKEELFKSDPDRFIDINDIAIAVMKRDNTGRRVLVNTANPDEMGACLYLMQRQCNKTLDILLSKSLQDSKIIQSVAQELCKK